MKHTFHIVIALALLLCMIMPANAAENDIDGNWAQGYIETLQLQGVLHGDGNGMFRPNAPITRAEFATMVNRVFGFVKDTGKSFADVKVSDWFAKDISIAATQGYLGGMGQGMAAPSLKLSREQAAVIIGRVMKLSDDSGKTDFKDDEQISPWAREMVSAVAKAGYIKGWDGFFRAKDNITRGEVAAILTQATGQLYNKAGAFDGGDKTFEGNVTISVSDVTLENMTINGNLYLTEGIGEGTVKLDKVKVAGQTMISGGGVNSIYLFNTTLGTVVVDIPDGNPARIVAKDSSTGEVEIKSPVRLEQTGIGGGPGFGRIYINAPLNATVTLAGKFENVIVNSVGAIIYIPDGSSVQNLTVKAGAKITGPGVIQTANISATGVIIEQKPVSTTIAAGLTASINGHNITGGQSSPSSSSSGGGSDGRRTDDPVVKLSPIYEIDHPPQLVALSCATNGAAIYYTLDSSDPRKSVTRKLYSLPFKVEELTHINFYATKAGSGDSLLVNASIDVYSMTARRKVEVDASKLILSGIEPDGVRDNLTLPTVGEEFNSAITWTSSNPLVISTTGVVTRPSGTVNAPVRLTATLSLGEAIFTKVFDFVVKANDSSIDGINRELPALAYDPVHNRYLCVYKRGDQAHTLAETGIYGRFVSPAGSYLDEEFVIAASGSIGTFSLPCISYDIKAQRFLVAWDDARDNAIGGQWNVYGQFVDSEGVPIGGIFSISDIGDDKVQSYPGMAFDSVNGSFLIIYRQEEPDSKYSLRGRLVKADGSLDAEQTIVSEGWEEGGTFIAFNGEKYLVTYGASGNRVKLVNSDGTPEEDAWTLCPPGYQGVPIIAYNDLSEQFMTVWSTRYVGLSELWTDDIVGSLIEKNGSSGNPFVIADQTRLGQFYPAVAAVGEGFAVVWLDAHTDTNRYDLCGALIKVDGTVSAPFDIASNVGDYAYPAVCGGTDSALIAYALQIGDGFPQKDIRIKAMNLHPTAVVFATDPEVTSIDADYLTLNLSANERATAYYVVVKNNTTFNLTAEQMKAAVLAEETPDCVLLRGSDDDISTTAQELDIYLGNKLYADQDYDLYLVLEGENGGFSELKKLTFHTEKDTSSPEFISYGNSTGIYSVRSRALTIQQSVNDRDEFYDLYVWVVKAEDAPLATPSAADVKSKGKAYRQQRSGYGNGQVITYTGLEPMTAYKVYLVAQDYSTAGSAGAGLFSEVMVCSESTKEDTYGPQFAGISESDCYTMDAENKTLSIQFDGALYMNSEDASFYNTLKTKIRIYAGIGDALPLTSGDEVVINGDTLTITFAERPADGFQLYIDRETIAYLGNQERKNSEELYLRILLNT